MGEGRHDGEKAKPGELEAVVRASDQPGEDGEVVFRRLALDPAYAAMARDETREAEALEWAEGLMGDALDDSR